MILIFIYNKIVKASSIEGRNGNHQLRRRK